MENWKENNSRKRKPYISRKQKVRHRGAPNDHRIVSYKFAQHSRNVAPRLYVILHASTLQFTQEQGI